MVDEMRGQRLTDEQLTAWDARCWTGMAGLGLREQRALLAEVRAARAREAELTDERDGLRQQVDKVRTLAEAARSLVPAAPYSGVGWQALLDIVGAARPGSAL